MRSPLDDVPPLSSLSVENASLRVLFVAAIILLLFALTYLIVFPNRSPESYSTLTWGDTPSFVSETNSTFNRGRIVFSIHLSSFEKSETFYRANIEYEGRTVATKNVSLFPGEKKLIDFSIPVKGLLDAQNQIRVAVTKPSADVNANKDDGLLELIGYFSRPN